MPVDARSIRIFINLEREYTMRWSPLNLSLISPYLEIETLDTEDLDTNTPSVVFDMPALAYALVTMDLRHIPLENYNWKYGEDWSISFSLDANIKIGDLANPSPMPEQFLSYK